MSTDTQNNAPVSTEPLNWPAIEARISEFVNDYEMVGEDELGRDGCYTPSESERALILDAMHGAFADDELMALLRPAAPVAAQAQPEGVTLDGCLETLFHLGEYLGVDYAASRKAPGAPSGVYIKAIEEKGFKARDAALEEAAVAMEQTSRQGGALVIRALKSGSEAQQPVSGADGFDAWIKREYPWLGPIGNDVAIAREAWGAALAQQDADKVDAALAEMVHAMFRSGNSVPVTRITIDRKQYEAAIDADRKEQA